MNDIKNIYVRDASGNVIAVYKSENGNDPILEEAHIYGSSRIGMQNAITKTPQIFSITSGFGTAFLSTFTRGEKIFELSNHLGNVLETVNDKKIAFDTDADDVIDYYEADVVTANDYYPFGMIMPGRLFSSESYRYGFNGKELDKEVVSTSTYDYGFRIYSPALSKFMSVDPLMHSYPFYTPYQFAGNNPIKFIDLDGREPVSPAKELESIRLVHGVEKGNIVSGYFDPTDKMHYMDVEKVYDPAKDKSYFISEKNGQYIYWKSQESTIRVHTKIDGSVEANGSWEIYESYDQRKARFANEIARGFGTAAFGIAAVGTAVPSAIAVAPSVTTALVSYGTGALKASLGLRLGSVGVNTTFQYIQNAPDYGFGKENFRNMNVTSLGLSFLNPSAITANAFGSNFGKVSIARQSSEAIGGDNFDLKSAIIGSAIDFGGGKLSDALGLKSGVYTNMNKLQSQTFGDVISGAVTTPINTVVNQVQQKNP